MTATIPREAIPMRQVLVEGAFGEAKFMERVWVEETFGEAMLPEETFGKATLEIAHAS